MIEAFVAPIRAKSATVLGAVEANHGNRKCVEVANTRQ